MRSAGCNDQYQNCSSIQNRKFGTSLDSTAKHSTALYSANRLHRERTLAKRTGDVMGLSFWNRCLTVRELLWHDRLQLVVAQCLIDALLKQLSSLVEVFYACRCSMMRPGQRASELAILVRICLAPVSYTHLTLPTIYSV